MTHIKLLGVTMAESRFNTIALITFTFAIIAFGGSVVQSYVRTNERLALSESRQEAMEQNQQLLRAEIQDLKIEIKGYSRQKP